jgi:DNA-binding MarR family transcriptional regulator
MVQMVENGEIADLIDRFSRGMKPETLLKNFHLTATQALLLYRIKTDGPSRVSDIAMHAGISPGAISQTCEELERSGLLERTRSLEDRRVVMLTLTEMGRETISKVREARTENLLNILDELAVADKEDFFRILKSIIRIMESKNQSHK